MSRRARRLFGVPLAFQWMRTRGLRIERVRNESVQGEWIVPQSPEKGEILYVHGGGFVACSAATHRPITAGLARLSGRRVFSVDYRLAPEHRFPAALDDVVEAYRWLLEQGVSPSSLTLAGDSAGGGLVLSTLVRVRDIGLPLPASALCFSPWTDLAGSSELSLLNDGRCAMFHPENVVEFAKAYLGDISPMDPCASPVFADLGGLPPILLQVGSTELLLDDARRIHQKVQSAGGVSRLDIFDDVCHGWQMLDGLLPEARLALTQAAEFIKGAVDCQSAVASEIDALRETTAG